MTVLIFGASGKSGVELVKECLKNNFTVKCFVRNPQKLDEFKDRVKIIQGRVEDYEKIKESMNGVDCVMNVLGHSKNTPANMQTVAIKNIIQAMYSTGVKRLITLTGAGVFAEGDKPSTFDNLITSLLKFVSNARVVDGINFVEEIKKSDLNWTVFRAPILTNAPKTNNVKLTMVGDKSVNFSVSRKDIAQKFVEVINDSTTFKKLPYIATIK